MARDITIDVVRTSNSPRVICSSSSSFTCSTWPLDWPTLVVNGIRILRGKITPDDTIRLHTGGVYWHFLGLLVGIPVRFPLPHPLRMT